MSEVQIRPLDPESQAELDLVAQRMRLTLQEVLDPARGTSLYTMDWLRDRVRFHLDPQRCEGEVLLATDGSGDVIGHTIVRVEPALGPHAGLFSTTYVEPCHRRSGAARALVVEGERWLAARGCSAFATNTSEGNAPLIRLFEGLGYAITLHDPGTQGSPMVQLTKQESG